MDSDSERLKRIEIESQVNMIAWMVRSTYLGAVFYFIEVAYNHVFK